MTLKAFTILNFIWGFPQTILGFALFILHAPFNKSLFSYKGAVISVSRFRLGFSLGLFIFIHKPYTQDMVKHEFGHSIQSAILGPFYLLTIGIISPIRSLIISPILYYKKKWEYNHVIYWYYNGFPEKWADKLGEVKRNIKYNGN